MRRLPRRFSYWLAAGNLAASFRQDHPIMPRTRRPGGLCVGCNHFRCRGLDISGVKHLRPLLLEARVAARWGGYEHRAVSHRMDQARWSRQLASGPAADDPPYQNRVDLVGGRPDRARRGVDAALRRIRWRRRGRTGHAGTLGRTGPVGNTDCRTGGSYCARGGRVPFTGGLARSRSIGGPPEDIIAALAAVSYTHLR